MTKFYVTGVNEEELNRAMDNMRNNGYSVVNGNIETGSVRTVNDSFISVLMMEMKKNDNITKTIPFVSEKIHWKSPTATGTFDNLVNNNDN